MFESKKETAIKLLTDQKNKLSDKKTHRDKFWVAQTADMVNKYIGSDSMLHQAVLRITFMAWVSRQNDYEQNRAAYQEKVDEAERCLDSCIEFIKLNGVKQSGNWFSKRTTSEIVGMIALFQALLFTIILPFTCNQGKIQGASEAKDEIRNLKTALSKEKTVKDSLRLVISKQINDLSKPNNSPKKQPGN